MLLYIIRHAHAYEYGDPRWPDDSRRPLEKKGVERFTQVVKLLAQRGFEPEIIATSPYVRCRQTAGLVADHSANSPEIVELSALTPGSDLEATLRWSQQQEVESMAWVGHSPDVNRFAAAMIGDGSGSIRFAKGAVASIRIHGELAAGAGELNWLATAKLLGV